MKVSYFLRTAYAPGDFMANRAAEGEFLSVTARDVWDSEYGVVAARESLELAALADELGFDYVSVSEHHFVPEVVCPNPAITAAALTQVVKHAQIAILGPLVSIKNNPVRIAEELAMLDQLSGGRIIALPLRGSPSEYTIGGIDPAQTKGRTQEATLLIKKALTELQPFEWKGEHFEFPVVSVWPGPTQRPHMPLYFSANSDDSIEFAARHQLGAAVTYYGLEDTAKNLATYRELCRQHGWTPAEDQTMYRGGLICGNDETHTEALVARSTERQPVAPKNQLLIPDAMKNLGLALGGPRFVGAPHQLFEQISEWHQATGLGILDIGFGGARTSEETADQMRTFAKHVMPRLQEELTYAPQ